MLPYFIGGTCMLKIYTCTFLLVLLHICPKTLHQIPPMLSISDNVYTLLDRIKICV